MQASVFSAGSQRPSPIRMAFEAPQAASNSTSAGSAQLSKGPRPVDVEAQQSPRSKPQPALFSAASQAPSPRRPFAAVCAAGHVGALPAATTAVGSSHHISVMPLSESCSVAYCTIASSSDAENRASFRDILPDVRRPVCSASFLVSFRFGGVRGPVRPDRRPSRGSARSRGVRSRSRFVGERPSASDPSPWSTAARERFVVDVRGASTAVIP